MSAAGPALLQLCAGAGLCPCVSHSWIWSRVGGVMELVTRQCFPGAPCFTCLLTLEPTVAPCSLRGLGRAERGLPRDGPGTGLGQGRGMAEAMGRSLHDPAGAAGSRGAEPGLRQWARGWRGGVMPADPWQEQGERGHPASGLASLPLPTQGDARTRCPPSRGPPLRTPTGGMRGPG